MLKKLISGIISYKSVVAQCCTFRLLDISISATGLRFILSLNSICKGIPEALKSLYRSPGYKKNQLVLCKNYVLQW